MVVEVALLLVFDLMMIMMMMMMVMMMGTMKTMMMMMMMMVVVVVVMVMMPPNTLRYDEVCLVKVFSSLRLFSRRWSGWNCFTGQLPGFCSAI